MHFYGKKFLGNQIRNTADQTTETRDGIVWDVLTDQRLCRVKIQGSDQLIVAWYPENWEKTPVWMKPGNAVRIIHTQGKRGRIEVVGHGQCVPTSVSGRQFPISEIPTDAIISGCKVIPCDTPRMAVLEEIGELRFSGVLYDLPVILMGDGNYQMGDGGKMGVVAGVTTINAAPASPNFRLDLLSIASDLVIDYDVGTPAAVPVVPELDSVHFMLANVRIRSDTTEILKTDISGAVRIFKPPSPSYIMIGITKDDIPDVQSNFFDFGSADPDQDYAFVRVTVYDQYNVPIAGTGQGWHIELSIQSGSGTVLTDVGGESDLTFVNKYTGTSSHTTFIYKMDSFLLKNGESPILNANLVGTSSSAMGYITFGPSTSIPSYSRLDVIAPASGDRYGFDDKTFSGGSVKTYSLPTDDLYPGDFTTLIVECYSLGVVAGGDVGIRLTSPDGLLSWTCDHPTSSDETITVVAGVNYPGVTYLPHGDWILQIIAHITSRIRLWWYMPY